MKWVKRILLVFTVPLSFILIFSYASMYINPEKVWFSPFFGLAYIPIVIVHLIFTFLWLWLDKKVFVYMLVVFIIGIKAHSVSYAFHFPNSTEKENSDVRLLTFNVRGFDEFSSKTTQAYQQSIVQAIADVKPDIVCLQEFSSYHNSTKGQDNYLAVKKATGLQYEYYYKVFENKKHTRSYGILILSRYPVTNSGQIEYNALSKTNSTIYADLDINGTMVRVITAHLQSNQLTSADLDIVESPNAESIKDLEAKRIVSNLSNSYKLRAGQAKAIADARDQSPYPVIICGDFNDTPVSFAYRNIAHNMQDAFLHEGTGLGATFKPFPFIRIDYVLLQEDKFSVLDYKRIANPGSDHFMVSCVFSISDKNSAQQ